MSCCHGLAEFQLPLIVRLVPCNSTDGIALKRHEANLPHHVVTAVVCWTGAVADVSPSSISRSSAAEVILTNMSARRTT